VKVRETREKKLNNYNYKFPFASFGSLSFDGSRSVERGEKKIIS
jgi:hypothetical protein